MACYANDQGWRSLAGRLPSTCPRSTVSRLRCARGALRKFHHLYRFGCGSNTDDYHGLQINARRLASACKIGPSALKTESLGLESHISRFVGDAGDRDRPRTVATVVGSELDILPTGCIFGHVILQKRISLTIRYVYFS